MRPLRRKQTTHLTTDPVTGQERVLGWSEERDVLSDQGSVDSASVQRTFFLDCGCQGQPAGRCFECGAISCGECHGRCQRCRKPICMQHSRFVETEQGPVRLCGECADKLSRKQTRTKIGRFFLSLFVATEDSHE